MKASTETERRPWGSFQVVMLGPGYWVKLLCVTPGQRLSRQVHQHRDERWLVLEGHGLAEAATGVHPIGPGMETRIPRGTPHRLTNTGTEPLLILELAYGEVDENDIRRLSDDYGRATKESA